METVLKVVSGAMQNFVVARKLESEMPKDSK